MTQKFVRPQRESHRHFVCTTNSHKIYAKEWLYTYINIMKERKKNIRPRVTTKLHHKFDIFAIFLMGANNDLMRTQCLHGYMNIIFFNLSFGIVYTKRRANTKSLLCISETSERKKTLPTLSHTYIWLECCGMVHHVKLIPTHVHKSNNVVDPI